MITQFLQKFREHEWYPLLEFLSPVFFEIVPAWDMVRILTQLTRDSGKKSQQARYQDQLTHFLNQIILPIHLTQTSAWSRHERDSNLSRGDVILRLYFAQILHQDSCCLDLRHRSFQEESESYLWNPRYFVWQWQPSFLEALRAVYRGFYGDDNTLFEQGLRELNLLHAAPTFRKHFGGQEQRAVQFQLKDFSRTFHDIFVLCRDQHVRLPAEFLPFGLYLITLYEHLDRLGGAYDVRAAFTWAESLPKG